MMMMLELRGLMTRRVLPSKFGSTIVDIRLCQDFFYPFLDTLSSILEQKEFEDYRSFSGIGDDYHHRQFLEDIPG